MIIYVFLAFLLIVFVNGCGADKATEMNMEKVREGMTYKEVISIIGRPCLKERFGPAMNAAWRTPARDKGLYIEFANDRVYAIATFYKERIVLKGNGTFSTNIETILTISGRSSLY